jgi:hypothetical protein
MTDDIHQQIFAAKQQDVIDHQKEMLDRIHKSILGAKKGDVVKIKLRCSPNVMAVLMKHMRETYKDVNNVKSFVTSRYRFIQCEKV